MTLDDLCEPLFLTVCRLNRAARKGHAPAYDEARGEVESVLTEMRRQAAADAHLSTQFEKVSMPLMFFVDSMIAESDLPFADQWHRNRLAYEHNELAGDEKFFDLLDETLADRSEAATERLRIFYTCLGLGFTGWYKGQPEYLQSKMMELAGRLRREMDADEAGRLCPEAYEHTDESDLVTPPAGKVGGLVLLVCLLVASIFVVLHFVYDATVDEIDRDLTRIIGDADGAAEGAAASDGSVAAGETSQP